MSPPAPGIPTWIVAINFLLFSSTRLTVPSPWFSVQTEPPPAARKRGFGPTCIDSNTLPLAASTTVKTLLSTPVTQTIPLLKIGLYEARGIEIFCRKVFVDGSIRLSVPSLFVTIQTLSSLVVIPPSAPAGAIGSVALIVFFATSMRTRAGFFLHVGTQMLPNPEARPEQASPDTFTVATILFVAGSIRSTA